MGTDHWSTVMGSYRFVSTWKLRAPQEAVWERLADPEEWQSSWRWLDRVELLRPGDEDGVGARRRYVVRSPLPYSLTFGLRTTSVKPPHTWEAEASGELEGTGRWDLTYQEGVTTARYTWDVRTSKAWMNVVGPLARPAFGWAHGVVMRDGARSLARDLGAELLSVDGSADPPSRTWPVGAAGIFLLLLAARRLLRPL